MKTRTLGKSGLEVSALGLGCMGMRDKVVIATKSDSVLARKPAACAQVALAWLLAQKP